MTYFTYQSKQIYFEEIGNGPPLILLHGNTASAKMFDLLLPLYTEHFHVILLDFLGNGRSERIAQFPKDLWYTQSLQVLALIDHLGYEKVNLLGTSGGAWTAINAALERPDVIEKVIADSFDGRTLNKNFFKNLMEDRTFARQDPMSRQFYEWCQGDDWEQIVDLDTACLFSYQNENIPPFHHPIEQLQVPTLLIGSLEDALLRDNLEAEYKEMCSLIADGSYHLFPKGGHPSMATNAEETAKLVKEFLDKKS
ncbi:alpha/beta fold hydrolase [Enterococcus sp. BWR-S5]|uniref:alpha/beta fold hydrolase n=1 Tax=Enterococcus sp. BWR-S5 TaxID=2787714 RepID=UPI001921FBEE|nr:alpha/beta hydrolase [Enterococcus sp. BWR-S5]MBL1223860.1 alpha/beta hydrolase [Enterococcus sp. BWR-S5]